MINIDIKITRCGMVANETNFFCEEGVTENNLRKPWEKLFL